MLGEETILFYSFIYIKRLRILLSLLDKNCNFHALFLFQLIFRKVSDVLKEQELAERRKNDPVLNKSEDKLVRKLFNKFKKGPDCGPGGGTVGPDHSKTAPLPLSLSAITNNRLDVEKGGAPPKRVSDAESIGNSLITSAGGMPKKTSVTSAGGMSDAAGNGGVTPLETISEPVVAVPKKKIGGWGRLKVI